MLIGFMFVKEEKKKKIIKIIKDNASLIGAGLVLLFLINGISGFPTGGGIPPGEEHESVPTTSSCGS